MADKTLLDFLRQKKSTVTTVASVILAALVFIAEGSYLPPSRAQVYSAIAEAKIAQQRTEQMETRIGKLELQNAESMASLKAQIAELHRVIEKQSKDTAEIRQLLFQQSQSRR